jgi:hypothetical protein
LKYCFGELEIKEFKISGDLGKLKKKLFAKNRNNKKYNHLLTPILIKEK